MQAQFDNLEFDNGPHSMTRVVLRYRAHAGRRRRATADKKPAPSQTLKFMKEQGSLMALRDEPGETGQLAEKAFFEFMNPKIVAGENIPGRLTAAQRRRGQSSAPRRARCRGAVTNPLPVAPGKGMGEMAAHDPSNTDGSRRHGASGALAVRAPGAGQDDRAKTCPPSGHFGRAIGVGEIITPDGAKVSMACTPTGLELCFDATDNNCNGIIDEGCGVQTGPLQFAIAWAEGADVDLNVTDPQGELVKPGERTAAGLAKDRIADGRRALPRAEPGKRVFRGRDRRPRGTTKSRSSSTNPSEARFPVKVRFGGRIGVKTFALDVQLAAAGDAKAPAVARSEDSTKWWVTIPIELSPSGLDKRAPRPGAPYTVETALGVLGMPPR